MESTRTRFVYLFENLSVFIAKSAKKLNIEYVNPVLQTSGKGAGQFKYETTGAGSKAGQSTAGLQDAQPAAGRSSFK